MFFLLLQSVLAKMAENENTEQSDMIEAVKLLQRANIYAKLRIFADQLGLTSMTFGVATALQPNDLASAIRAQFDVEKQAEDGPPTPVGTAIVNVASEWLHNASERAVTEAKLTKRQISFDFILDPDEIKQEEPPAPICSRSSCGKVMDEVHRCNRCHGPLYCCQQCRQEDWTEGHSGVCSLVALARIAQDPADSEEGPPACPSGETLALGTGSPLPATRTVLGLFQETAMAMTDALAVFNLLQTARFSSRVVLFVDVQSYDAEPLLSSVRAQAQAERDAATAMRGGGSAEGEEEEEEAEDPSVVVRRVYVTAVPVYQLLLLPEAANTAAAKSGAFAEGGPIRKRVGPQPIKTGVRDERVGKEGAVLALPRAVHASALSKAKLGTALSACIGGSVPHARFPATPQGRLAAFQAGDTVLTVFRDMDSGFMATAIMQPDVPSQALEAAVRSCRRADEGGFNALLQADVLLTELIADAPGRPSQSVTLTTAWREEDRE